MAFHLEQCVDTGASQKEVVFDDCGAIRYQVGAIPAPPPQSLKSFLPSLFDRICSVAQSLREGAANIDSRD